MLQGKNILCFAIDHWDGFWQSRHQIMSRLAKRNRVLFVSPPFYLRNVVLNIKQRYLPISGTTQVDTNLYWHVPSKFFPYNYRFKPFNQFSAWARRKKIALLLKHLRMKDVVLFIWNPIFADEVGHYHESMVCYFMDDEFSALAGISAEDKKICQSREKKLCEKSDIVFASSSALLTKKSYYIRPVFVPNGVDFELFNKAPENQTIKSIMQTIPGPRIGYVGSINRKFDFSVIQFLATRHPEWSFILIGPIKHKDVDADDDYHRAKSLKNVHFFGKKDVNDLPHYVRELDVCLMNYRLDCWALYGYPLKLHEYLACGKPCVASNLMTLQEFSGVIRIAHNLNEWEQFIGESINENDPYLVKKRIQVAEQNSWEKRIDTISNSIESWIHAVSNSS